MNDFIASVQDSASVPATAGPPSGKLASRLGWMSRWRTPLLLILITALGGLMRFVWLDRPVLWGDECLVAWRTCGTYRDLLTILQNDGFTPLHYTIYWAIAQHATLTPAVMRVPPALYGTLMIPVMYFLASQVIRRPAALLTAAFTACSAWMLIYSRDAKMYMGMWLFLALSTACLLWWLRTRRRIAWLAWVAAGIAATGMHALAGVVLGVHVLVALTARGINLKRVALLCLGLTIVGAGLGGYYWGFNRWPERTGLVSASSTVPINAGWERSGLGWITYHNRGRSGGDLLAHTATAQLFGWSLSEQPHQFGTVIIPHQVLAVAWATFGAMLAVFAIGALPWPRWAITGKTPPPQSLWRSLLWLSVWLVVPTYGLFYCRSIQPMLPPAYWLQAFEELIGGHWFAGAVLIAALAGAAVRWRWVAQVCLLILPIVAAGTALIAAGHTSLDGLPPSAMFAERWLHLMTRPWLALAVLSAAAAGAYWTSADTHRRRLAKLLQLLGVAAAVYLLCYAAYVVASELYAKACESGNRWDWQSIWMPRYLGVVWPPLAITVASLLMRLPTRALRSAIIAAVLVVNLVQPAYRLFAHTEVPLDLQMRDVLAYQGADSRARTYIGRYSYGGGFGSGSIHHTTGIYYLTAATGIKVPQRLYRRQSPIQFVEFRDFADPERVARDAQQSPQLERLVVWDRLEAGLPNNSDRLAKRLGEGWRMIDEQLYPVRLFWSRQEMHTERRREYLRQTRSPSAANADEQ